MTRQTFSKPALSLDAQIVRLRQKGMNIADEERAKAALRDVSYYRMSAYWLPFEYPKAQQTRDLCFRPGTDFATVSALHDFDRDLRRRTSEAIEVVEIALRGNWALRMAELGSGHAYLDARHYRDQGKFEENLRRLKDEVRKSKETFIEHYRRTYAPEVPPVWMASEVLSFGSLSHWYANLKDRALRQAIADPFGLDERVFKTYIHHLTVVRNTCAHHSRLWNRHFKVPLLLPRRPANLAASLNPAHPRQLYNTLAMLAFSLKQLKTLDNWPIRLSLQLRSLPHGDLGQLGFPANYTELPVWDGVLKP